MKLKYNEKVHGYWLDGVRCKGVSTVAKIPDDTYSLDAWRKRMVAIGVADSLDLVRDIRAARDDNATLNELAEKAIDIAGGKTAAREGTASHALTEKHDKGEEVREDEQRTLERWRTLLSRLDMELVLVEQMVVYPDLHICGRFDRVGQRNSDGALFTLDQKTGKNAVTYPHSTAAQLALYANAPLLATNMTWDPTMEKCETENFVPMPPGMNKEVGYMLHLPQDGEDGIYAVNLKKGWHIVGDIIIPTLHWRSVKPEDIIRAV